MPKTQVYLIGAGPGEKDLITLKGLGILSAADVILYDHLIGHELLDLAKPDAEKISVGKFASNHTLPQEEINALIVQKAREGKIVARLKGGDCYLFGRGGEEAEACFEAGLSFEVVPGITSALAAPCYAGIPPTHRDCASSVAIITGHRRRGDSRPIDIPRADTLIFLMSVNTIETIIRSLLEAGYPSDMQIAAVENGTFYNQRIIKGTIGNFLDIIKNNPLRTPAVFIAGRVVQLQDKLDWFSRKPRILHLGTHPERCAHLGTIVHRPIIQCVEAENTEQINRCLRQAGQYDWIVFTSSNGVKFFFKKLLTIGLDSRIFSKTRFAVIGRTTGQHLLEFGIRADLCPADESSRGLLEEFAKIDMAGLSILLPQADISSPELPDGLVNRGAKLQRLIIYHTIEKDIEDVDLDCIDKILFTSGSTVRAFVKKFGTVPKHIQALCLGIPTQTTAREFNIDAAIVNLNNP